MIPVYQPFLCGNEKRYVNECLDSSWISSRGEFIPKFEQAFAQRIGANHATSVCNGTVALHLALEALGIGPGDEVIVPTLTYIASVNTIAQTGAKPVFVDACADTWNLDIEDVKRKLTPATKAVMVVHLYGLPCNMDPITELCRDRKIRLIEDCAEAFGSLYKDRHVGTFGDIATFSFFGNKTITTGEGGMVVSADAAIHAKAMHLKAQGVDSRKEYWHDVLGYNYRMTNICAAIGLAQLEQADTILQKKRRIAQHYQTALADLPLGFHQETASCVHSYWMCSVSVERADLREPLRGHLKDLGIETRPVFYPAHIMPVFKEDLCYPVAEKIAACSMNLPSWPGMTNDQMESVTSGIRSFFLR